MTDHKQWLDNEYAEWVKALQESTVHNFKEHPGVKRMLGEPDKQLWRQAFSAEESPDLTVDQCMVLQTIDNIGREKPTNIDGRCIRMMYYAQRVLARNPSSICEIGGGVGQFYATLRVLGYKGDYTILDISEVKKFQRDYLNEVRNRTGMGVDSFVVGLDMIVSFYALGEFDNETRESYRELISNSPHGYIAWNPHSGASDSLSIFENHDIKVTPGIEPGISIIEW